MLVQPGKEQTGGIIISERGGGAGRRGSVQTMGYRPNRMGEGILCPGSLQMLSLGSGRPCEDRSPRRFRPSALQAAGRHTYNGVMRVWGEPGQVSHSESVVNLHVPKYCDGFHPGASGFFCNRSSGRISRHD